MRTFRKISLSLCMLASVSLVGSLLPINQKLNTSSPQDKKILTTQMRSVQMAAKIESLDVLVNKTFVLPSTYVPKNLVIADSKIVKYTTSGNAERNHVRKEVAAPLVQMMQAAKKNKLDIWVSSAYRSFQRQKQIFNQNVAAVGLEKTLMVSARPGRSEHQTGLAIDFTTKSVGFSLEENFANTKEGKWLKANAHKYGFILRYPKGQEKVTGYKYEPWHFRYVGKDIANEIHRKNWTYEVYIANQS